MDVQPPPGCAAAGDVGAHHVEVDERRVDFSGGAGLPVPAGVAGVPAQPGQDGGGGVERVVVLRRGHLLADAVVVDLPADQHGVAVTGRDGAAAAAGAGVVAAAGGDDVEDAVVVDQRLAQRAGQVGAAVDADVQRRVRVARAGGGGGVVPQHAYRVERAGPHAARQSPSSTTGTPADAAHRRAREWSPSRLPDQVGKALRRGSGGRLRDAGAAGDGHSGDHECGGAEQNPAPKSVRTWTGHGNPSDGGAVVAPAGGSRTLYRDTHLCR